jgi:hypothetical protein
MIMVEMKRKQELHHRFCDGELLSEEEQAELEAWYAQMDAEESAMLHFTEESSSVENLRTQLEREASPSADYRKHSGDPRTQ